MAKKTFNTQALADDLAQSAFFTPRPPQEPVSKPVPVPAESRNPVTPQTRKPGAASPQPRIPSPTEAQPTPPAVFTLNLEAKADQKYTTYFTEQEHELLEDIKLEVRRRYGYKTTKQEIIRCALGELIEDYQRHGSDSRFVQRLKTRDHAKK